MPPSRVDRWFRRLQLVSAAFFSLNHGANDAQKTMGIIAILLFSGGYLGSEFYVPLWVILAAHAAIGLGTLAGFVLGLVVMGLLMALVSWIGSFKNPRVQRFGRPRFVNAFFGKAQIISASAMGLSHGLNDAQKTMGIIALALAGATSAGSLDHLPAYLNFLRIEQDASKSFEIALWIKVVCALTMAAGTAAGGWRIIKTLGHKMVKLHPINGFAAETSSAAVIIAASTVGIPVSTTHNISAAIMGVGVAKRANAIKWTVVERMVWAWLLTIPIAGAIAYVLVLLAQSLGG